RTPGERGTRDVQYGRPRDVLRRFDWNDEVDGLRKYLLGRRFGRSGGRTEGGEHRLDAVRALPLRRRRFPAPGAQQHVLVPRAERGLGLTPIAPRLPLVVA